MSFKIPISIPWNTALSISVLWSLCQSFNSFAVCSQYTQFDLTLSSCSPEFKLLKDWRWTVILFLETWLELSGITVHMWYFWKLVPFYTKTLKKLKVKLYQVIMNTSVYSWQKCIRVDLILILNCLWYSHPLHSVSIQQRCNAFWQFCQILFENSNRQNTWASQLSLQSHTASNPSSCNCMGHIQGFKLSQPLHIFSSCLSRSFFPFPISFPQQMRLASLYGEDIYIPVRLPPKKNVFLFILKKSIYISWICESLVGIEYVWIIW